MAVTLLESAKGTKDVLRKATVKTITERSPVAQYVPFKLIKGSAYRFNQESSLPTVAWRAVGGVYVPNEGSVKPRSEVLSIFGGEVNIDRFIIKTQGNVVDEKAKQFDMKARAMAFEFDNAFFHGDSDSNPNQMDGLRKRIINDLNSNCNIDLGTGGATLSLDDLDMLLDTVVGESTEGKHLFMNKTLRRKISHLVRDQSGSYRIETKADQFGRPVLHYNDVPIHIMEHDNDESSILGFNEDDGQGNMDTASIYCVRFGDEDYVFCLAGGDSTMPDVEDFGELETAPRYMGRIEWYVGMAIAHPRAAARLFHINNA